MMFQQFPCNDFMIFMLSNMKSYDEKNAQNMLDLQNIFADIENLLSMINSNKFAVKFMHFQLF